MDSKLISTIVGLVAGAVGYWFANFHMKPILRFNDVRNQILMNFIFYAQVINADRFNEKMQELHRERILANRKTSAQLSASAQDLPWWYQKYLKFNGVDIKRAAKHLIGFSNTSDFTMAEKKETVIRRSLGLPLDEL